MAIDAAQYWRVEVKQKLLLRVPEAAELLSLSRSRVYQLMVQGCEPPFPVIHIGRSARVPFDALERWVACQSDAQIAKLRDETRSIA